MIESNLITYSDKHALASELTTTRQFGSTKSKLVDAIINGPCLEHINIRPGDESWYRIVTWIDANAQYHDRFVNSRPRQAPYDLPADAELRKLITDVHSKRCSECHNANEISRRDWINLRSPDKSLFLTTPLPKRAGGTGRCEKSTYHDQLDPDYARLRETLEKAVQLARDFPRRDLEIFVPGSPFAN